MDIECFIKWAVSLQSKEQYLSGGHINGIYFEKLKDFFTTSGFAIFEEMEVAKSLIKDIKKFETDNDRSKCSIFGEVIK